MKIGREGGGGNINAQYDVRHVTLARTMRQLQRETGDEPVARTRSSPPFG